MTPQVSGPAGVRQQENIVIFFKFQKILLGYYLKIFPLKFFLNNLHDNFEKKLNVYALLKAQLLFN